MKRIFTMLTVGVLLSSCGGAEKEETAFSKIVNQIKKEQAENKADNEQSSREKKETKKKEKRVSPFEIYAKNVEILAEKAPMPIKEMKTWLPEEIDGMQRSSFKSNSMGLMKISSITAVYKNEDKSKSYTIEVLDGAGSGATSLMGMQMALAAEFEEEDEFKVRQTSERDGIRVIEEYKKNNNNSNIQFIHASRYYIQIKGEDMSLDELWSLKDTFNFDDLKK